MKKLTMREIEAKSPYLYWAIIAASTRKDKDITNIWPELPKDGKWSIQLIVNGVELPVVDAFEQIRKQDRRRIEEEAIKLIQKKFDNLQDTLDELTKSTIDKFSKELGVEVEE